MTSWSGKIAALFLMLVLPLQGAAAVLMPLTCHDGGGSPAIAAHDHDHAGVAAHEHAVTSGTEQHHGAPADDYAGHLCCHQVFSGVPALSLAAAPDLPPTYDAYHPAAPVPFVPERLQRPPRA